MANFPFAKKEETPAAPTAAPAAPTAAPAAPTAAPVAAVEGQTEKPAKVKKTKKSGEDRKKPAAQMTPEQVKQVLVLIKDHSYTEVAEMIGITKFQVNRVLMTTKKSLKERAGDDPAKLAKVEEYIKNHLSRPEDTLPGKGGGGRGGKVKSALDDVVSDILAGL
ncbi:MAG: hypothetical protein WC188_03200 [Candidatus Caldatribacteriota bacterium]